jgi:hypothetical protein
MKIFISSNAIYCLPICPFGNRPDTFSNIWSYPKNQVVLISETYSQANSYCDYTGFTFNMNFT